MFQEYKLCPILWFQTPPGTSPCCLESRESEQPPREKRDHCSLRDHEIPHDSKQDSTHYQHKAALPDVWRKKSNSWLWYHCHYTASLRSSGAVICVRSAWHVVGLFMEWITEHLELSSWRSTRGKARGWSYSAPPPVRLGDSFAQNHVAATTALGKFHNSHLVAFREKGRTSQSNAWQRKLNFYGVS